jgi:hypothetical protein
MAKVCGFMSILNTLKKYPDFELYTKEKGYELYQLIVQLEREQSLWVYAVGLGIPAYSALNLLSKMITDVCRIIDTIIQTIAQGEYAGGNVQTLLVDAVEYARSFIGMTVGLFVMVYSPNYAAELFLTAPVDPDTIYLTPDEGARLYAMADVLHAFFIRHEIDYRISCGTALGALREGGVIRNDDDMDLMIHPDSVEKFKDLCEAGVFTRETGIDIVAQEFTGGWQCFYSDSPKGALNTPLEHTGKPFIDIFPGISRLLGDQPIITYGNANMSLQSKGDYFTEDEWATRVEYPFGPTKLFGIEPNLMEAYLYRSYGPSALKYVNRLYPHEAYTEVYQSPLSVLSILSQYPYPRALRHTCPSPLEFDQEVYESKRALARMPAEVSSSAESSYRFMSHAKIAPGNNDISPDVALMQRELSLG